MPDVWRRDELPWQPAGDGVFVARLHRHEGGGGAAVFRLDAGAKLSLHDHPVGEHTFVVEGVLEFGADRLERGDAMWTRPGEHHEVRAITDAVFFAVAPPKSTP